MNVAVASWRDDPPAIVNGTRRPHDLVKSSSVLGAIVLGAIVKHEGVLAGLPELEVDDFLDVKHKVVFGAMRALEAASKPTNVDCLEAEISEQGKLEAIGGRSFLSSITDYACAPSVVRRNVETLRGLRYHVDDTIEADERELRQEDELDELALRDAEPRTIAIAEPPLRDPKLCPRLDAFLGAEEPDDDDAEEWNVRDILPREPTLWGARMKGGKTWAAMDLALALALGVDWLGFENTRRAPVNVLGVFIEDGKRRLRRRLWELCRGRGITPNDDRLREHLSITREPIRLPDDARQLERRLKRWAPAVILVDNLTRVMVGDPNSTRDAAAFTKAWCQLGDELGAAILFLHHTRKTNGGGDDKRRGAGDPFDTLRGSGDFGAAARHLIVSKPIDGDGFSSEVYMRGNLDLSRDSFVLGFERTQMPDGRWQARLANRGAIEEVRANAGETKRAEREAKERAERAEKIEQRRNVALEIARTKGSCSTNDMAERLGGSPRTFAPVLKSLVDSGVFQPDKTRGYVFADGGAQ